MSISKSKRRYTVSLTPSVVERFQGLVQSLGMPNMTISVIAEAGLIEASRVFELAREKGSLGLDDLARLIGQQQQELDLLKREKNVKPAQETKAVAKRAHGQDKVFHR